MLLASGMGLPGPTGRPDLVGFATTSRPGVLLLARVGLALGGGIAVLILARRGRPEPATDLGALVATAVLALTVGAGHAAVFEPPVTIGVWFVHAAAAGVWLAGVAILAVLASQRVTDRTILRAVVRRYSALALVAVALFVLTGAYQSWLETGGLPAIDDPYGRLLIVKIVVVGIALLLGLASYLDGGELTGHLGGLARRSTIEAFLAAVAIVVTASLVAIPPPGPGRPIELAPSAPAVDRESAVRLAIGPGRPGPNRFTAVASGDGEPVSLRLVRDAGDRALEVPFRNRPGDADPDIRIADVLDLPAGSWQATVLVAPAEAPGSGAALPGGAFAFVLASEGITVGRASPPLDVGLLIGLLLIGGGISAVTWGRLRGRLPRTDPAAARIALVGGGLTAIVAGLLIVLLGPGG
jgi:putative copper export protein